MPFLFNHWVEIEVWDMKTTAYVRDYFEWTGSTSTMVRYYDAGTKEIRMMNITGKL